ncbi:unnamed protein product [Strongylus vulgaris]|uniref:Condensation domain-containing protein n=1 Tax=Strongylus vulgaris TaxID=40348 RepID=A0A3P7JE78_STRVU|nr:unnamed protein product [Strongylus vulgaris]
MLVVQDLSRHGLQLDLRSFFALRTAEKIAVTLEHLRTKKDSFKLKSTFNYEIPLLPQQKRLWFLARLHPNRDSYIIRLLVDIEGQLDLKRFNVALHRVLMSNPAVRSIIKNGKEPVFSRQSGTECFHDLSQDDVENPSINDNSLITARLRKCSSSFEFDLRIHHLISDGRSLAVLGEEIANAYNGGQTKKEDPTFFENSAHNDVLDFWKKYLSGYEPCSVDGNRICGVVEGEAGYVTANLSFIENLRVQEFCSTHQCTLYHLLVMAYVQTIRMTYDKEDVIVGTTVANRTAENINTVGLFANTIPLRFSKEFIDFKEQLAYTVEQILSAMEYQTTPLAKIIEEMVRERDVESAPLFQQVITFESTSINELPKMEGLTTKCRTTKTFYTQFDQSWIFHPGEGLSLTVQYDKSRFSLQHMTTLCIDAEEFEQ